MQNAMKPTLIAILLALTTTVHAGYTVMDDNIFPEHMVPASVAAAQARAAQLAQAAVQPTTLPAATAPTTYTLPFRKGYWGVTDTAAQQLTQLMPQLRQAKKITLIGRPDATSNDFLANQRGVSIQTWLAKNGIAPSRIELATNVNANTPLDDNTYPVEIRIDGPAPAAQHPATVTSQDIRTSVSASGIRTTIAPMPPQTLPTPTVAIVATPPADPRLDLIRSLAIAAQAGRLKPDAAIASIIEILAAGPNQPMPTPNTTTPPAPAKPDFGLTAAPETARPKEWPLATDKTLKDNVTEWAKKEGYTVDWRATNYYKVGRAQTLTGDLLEAVDKVTVAVKLNMEVWKRDVKLICISDAGQSCGNQ